jgi:hypothetical protein
VITDEERELRRRSARRRGRGRPEADPPGGRSNGSRRYRSRRSGAEWRRLRRLIASGAVLVVIAVTIGSTLRPASSKTPDPGANGPVPVANLLPTPPPQPLKLASRGAVILYVPISADHITAIAYHKVGGASTLDLDPSGKLMNAGILDRIEQQVVGDTAGSPDYYISGGSTASVDVGAEAGTEVYSPVNGTVVGISPYVLSGQAWGSQISIQPTADPTVVVVLTNLFPAPGLRVGQQVSATQQPTRLGTVADLSKVLKMDLAQYTSDAGNHVHIELRPTVLNFIP